MHLSSLRVTLFIVSLCEGGELFDRLDQTGSLSENDARIIFKQMVEAINYLHKNKIAHRDLKPENFLFLRKDSTNLKLIDFGLAIKWKESLSAELKKRGEKKDYDITSETIKGQGQDASDKITRNSQSKILEYITVVYKTAITKKFH